MKLRFLVTIAMLAAVVLVFGYLAANTINTKSKYGDYIKQAESFTEQRIPYKAALAYEQAFKIDSSNEDYYVKYLELVEQVDGSKYYSSLKKYKELFPNSKKAREMLCELYYKNEQFTSLVKEIFEARDAGLATERIKEIYKDIQYEYYFMRRGFEEANEFINGVSLIKTKHGYTYYANDNSFFIDKEFENASPFVNGAASVYENGEWVVVNSKAFCIARPSDPHVEYLSFCSSDRVLFKKNGKYGYAGSDYQIPEETPYDDATNFKSGVAAVKKNGKWALIDVNQNQITDYIFTDIIRDTNNTCISFDRVFACKDGKYIMLDGKGKQIGNQSFDNAYLFATNDQPTAIEVNGAWGFVNINGEIVIEPKAEWKNAKAFSLGLAPVYNGTLWGYINSTGEFEIDPYFDDCYPFDYRGIARIKTGDSLGYMQLRLYKS